MAGAGRRTMDLHFTRVQGMDKPYDTTGREYFNEYLVPLLDSLGLDPGGPVLIVDSAIATVAVEVDKVCRVEGPHPYLIHIELQADGDRALPRRCLRYNALLDLRHDLRVRTVVVLLRPEADTDNLTGTLELHLPDGRSVVQFHYEVIRLWQRPVEPLLAGDLGLLPLAPLADVPREQVRDIIELIDRRLVLEAPAATAGKIMNWTLMLAGMRLEKDEIKELSGRLRTMSIVSKSSYYQLLVEEGMEKGKEQGREQGREEGLIEGAQRLILHQGEIRFGPPEEAVRAAIEAIQDVDRLERLSEQLLVVSSWAELLAET